MTVFVSTKGPGNRRSPRRAARGRAGGFTLTEVLVAVAVLAVLAGAAVPVTAKVLRSARIGATKKVMAGLAEGLRAYGTDYGQAANRVKWGRFPPEYSGGGAYATVLGRELEEDVDGVGWNYVYRQGWNGPYVQGGSETVDATGTGVPAAVRSYQVDAWGRYFIYRNQVAGSRREVSLESGGPDRDPSTASDNIRTVVYRGATY